MSFRTEARLGEETAFLQSDDEPRKTQTLAAAGLTGDEQVVTTAAGFLRPGEQVKVAVQPAS